MSRPARILLVEDNEAESDLFREQFEDGRLRSEVEVSSSGSAAMLRLQARYLPQPDLVLLDLNLPGMHGRQVLAAMKADSRLRQIPVVILTHSAAEQDVIVSYDLGANCYITKPVDLHGFRRVVDSVEGFWFQTVRLPSRSPDEDP